MHRLLLIAAIITALTIGLFQITEVKREVLYKLGISEDLTTSCCQKDQVLNSTGNFDEEANIAIFGGEPIDYPKTSLAYQTGSTNPNVLGTTNQNGEEK